MNKETFAKYISNPSLLDNDSLPEIKAMLDEFPYFQSAWVLYIKNLHAIKDIRYESKLKTACAYISDRKHLHDILKGTYTPAIALVQTQGLASQEEIAEDTTAVQTQFIASPIEENPAEITQQEEATISQPEENPVEIASVQPQNIVVQPEEILEDTTIVQTQVLASQQEATTSQPEENPEEIAIQPENLVAQQEEILEDTTIVQTQVLASQQEATTSQPEENSEEITLQPQNIMAQPEEIAEDTATVQAQFIASQQETPTPSEPDKPESLADRILRQAEEMRRAKAAAAIGKELDTEIVKTQDIASQEEATISQPEDNPEGIATVQPQSIVDQDEPEENTTENVQTQCIASQEEATISQPEDNPEEIANVQPENLVVQYEPEENTTENVETQCSASQEEATISQPEENHAEITTVQPQNLVAKPEEISEDTAIVQTQCIASQAITPAQIKALLEKQLHDIGINANITFSGNSANIQFENITTDDKPEENPPEQPTADTEPSTEIPTTPTIDEQIEKRKNDRNKKANLIDKFIESKARIVPKKDYHSDNKQSTESIIEDEELFTEQLAKIYIKQGHLEKALETYEKLYLKYPEKNIYFATRIEYVKRLMNK